MAKTPLLMRWALVNLFLTAAAAGLTLFIWMTEQDVRATLAKVRQREKDGCSQRVVKSGKPPIVEPVAPPQDVPKSGYIGARGTDISPTMRVALEALRDGGPADTIESRIFGAQDVLPPGTIHVVNLWATWCAPCKAEMPDFKAMFDRHPEWVSDVRFVPILVKDAAEPRSAYQNFASAMPHAPVKLTDRGLNDPLVSALAPNEEVQLFKGNLPVTLVLDCNRRVRWARFEQLGEQDFKELEAFVDQFRAELVDTSEGAWCMQAWPGNGRCEGNEDTAANHSLEDCGELKRRPGIGGEIFGGTSDDPNVACPQGQPRGPDGKCLPKLKIDPKVAKASIPKIDTRCGNGKCETSRGESTSTCCQDCPCSEPLVCKPADSRTHSCQVNLK